MTAVAKVACILALLDVCCSEIRRNVVTGNCSDGGALGEGELLFDKAMNKFLTSKSLRKAAIPDFNHTARVAGFNLVMHFSNGTITGLSSVRRLGSNYVEAKENSTVRIRVGVKLDGLNVSIITTIKVLFFHIPVHIEAFVPAIRFVAEINESNNTLQVTHFKLNNTEKFLIRFRLLSGAWRMFNVIKWPLEKYLTWRVNNALPYHIEHALDQHLKKLSQRSAQPSEEQCTNCTMFDLSLRNAVLAYKLDPAPLPTSATSTLSTLIRVEVTNGTISGLSRLRQSGDFECRIDDCGVYVFLDLTVTNLTIAFAARVKTFFVDLAALVSATISARVVVKFVEKNSTLFLESLVINTTKPIDVNVTPIGMASASLTFFLPTKFIAKTLQYGLRPLVNNTIQNGLFALHKFVHENKPTNKSL
ncbi:uncharacterized protein LOC144123161 isoform X2 [Amblyomma americanum]